MSRFTWIANAFYAARKIPAVIRPWIEAALGPLGEIARWVLIGLQLLIPSADHNLPAEAPSLRDPAQPRAVPGECDFNLRSSGGLTFHNCDGQESRIIPI